MRLDVENGAVRVIASGSRHDLVANLQAALTALDENAMRSVALQCDGGMTLHLRVYEAT